jgi:hypothetical protein
MVARRMVRWKPRESESKGHVSSLAERKILVIDLHNSEGIVVAGENQVAPLEERGAAVA